jgi:1-deoxyxylulose-5-phosphate synthase
MLPMEYANLGRCGLKVSRVCLGMMTYGTPGWRDWVLDEAASRPFIVRALEGGINFFDTADVYSQGASEEILGRAVRELARRDELVIATKAFFPMRDGPNAGGLSRKHLFEAVDASLRRLGTDYIDLYQIHRWDESTPPEEVLRALDDIVRAGKVRYLGASSMGAWQFARALYLADRHGWSRFVSMQNHYNLAYREEEREMLPLCRAEGIGVIPWSPLARGLLCGTRQRGLVGDTKRAGSDAFAKQLYFHDADFDVADRVVEIAWQRSIPAAQVALAWLWQQPGVVAPIIGATRLEHLDEAIDALGVRLTPEECQRLEAPYVPHPVLGM